MRPIKRCHLYLATLGRYDRDVGRCRHRAGNPLAAVTSDASFVSSYSVFNEQSRTNRSRRDLRRAKLGGADRDRTDDLRLAKPALSQLSYSPVGQGRVELPTSRLSGVRSNHLSYWPSQATAVRTLGHVSSVVGCQAGFECVPGAVERLFNRRPRSLETEPYAARKSGS